MDDEFEDDLDELPDFDSEDELPPSPRGSGRGRGAAKPSFAVESRSSSRPMETENKLTKVGRCVETRDLH